MGKTTTNRSRSSPSFHVSSLGGTGQEGLQNECPTLAFFSPSQNSAEFEGIDGHVPSHGTRSVAIHPNIYAQVEVEVEVNTGAPDPGKILGDP